MKDPLILICTADASALNDDVLFARVYSTVSNERRLKTDRFRFRADKNLSLCAEWLLMNACKKAGLNRSTLHICTGQNGKPYFDDLPLHFSLSHSHTQAMCVLADFPVGCDVEYIQPPPHAVEKLCFSPCEIALLHACTSPAAYQDIFYRLWTLKESFIKCTGEGLSAPLVSFSVLNEKGECHLTGASESSRYALYEFSLHPEYRYALCIDTMSPKANLRHGLISKEQIQIFSPVVLRE